MSRSENFLYSYIVKIDTGLAPNPFWGYCTLAVCTPNHMGIRANENDWIIGTGSTNRRIDGGRRGGKLIFAMQISEVLHFADYYRNQRFEAKKPIASGTWRQRCGDNMYYEQNGILKQHHPCVFHCTFGDRIKDKKHPYVFIAKHFYYFGEKAEDIPEKYGRLIKKGIGCSKHKQDDVTVQNFLSWLENNFKPGIYGKPFDREKDCKSC